MALTAWLLGILLPVAAVTLFFAIERDGGAFLTIARGLLDGRLPYRDFFDHKPPGIYVVFAAALAVSGGSVWGVKALLLLLAAGLAFCTVQTLQALGADRPSRWLGGTLCLLGWTIYQGYAGVTEALAAFWVAASLWALLSGGRWSVAGAGALLGLAVLAKQPALLLALPWTGHLLRRQGARSALRGVLSFLLLPAAATALLYAAGAGPAALHQIVGVNSLSLPWSGLREAVKGNLAIFQVGSTLWTLGLLALAVDRRREVVLLGTLWAAAWIPVFLRPVTHYALLALPPAAVLAGLGAGWLMHRATGAGRYGIVVLMILPLWVPMLVPGLGAFSHNVLLQQIQVGRRLAVLTAPDEPVLVLAAEPQYYFLSHRYPPGSDLYLLAVNHSPEKEGELIDTIREGRVRTVVTADNEPTRAYGARVYAYVTANCRTLDRFPHLAVTIWGGCR
jgi:hypothetical protein